MRKTKTIIPAIPFFQKVGDSIYYTDDMSDTTHVFTPKGELYILISSTSANMRLLWRLVMMPNN